MKISLGSWAFSFGPYADNPIPFSEVAERLSQAGYDGIEVCGFPPHISLEDYPTTASRQEVARRLDSLGLGVSGYNADLSAVSPVIEENRTRYLDEFRRNVEVCSDLGSPMIRVDTGTAPGSIRNTHFGDARRRIAEVWIDAAAIAQDAGVRVSWEFEPGFAVNRCSDILDLLETVDHPNFGVVFDTAHAYMSAVVGSRHRKEKEILPGGVDELLEKLRPRINHVHLDDSDGTLYGDETSTHRPLGEGKIDLKSLAPKLLKLDGIDWWCVDLCFCADSWNLIGPSLEHARNLLTTVELD
jgi:sugar phosphate isomerase/epimerase